MTIQAEVENNPNYIKVLDHGFVGLIDHMGNDDSIVQAARVSYGAGTKKVSEDRGLIRYLLRHAHTTPFEMVTMKFHMKLPIFVARQLVRHRTASINEYSGRYSVMVDEFYSPELDRLQKQSISNKQGSGDSIEREKAELIKSGMDQYYDDSYKLYQDFISPETDLTRELARIVLPVANYTEWYWSINLHNLFHFLKLRMDSHAQQEIRVFAKAMYELIKPIVPTACEAFEDYKLNARNFSFSEVEMIKGLLTCLEPSLVQVTVDQNEKMNKREKEDFLKKFGFLG